MTASSPGAIPFAPRQRWNLFERRFGDRVRASDVKWAEGLSYADRLAIVEELFRMARTAHEASGDWAAVDARAWDETVAERRRFVHAFQRLDGVNRGRKAVADAD